MQFNSLIFIIFMVIFFAGWPLMRRRNGTRWTYLVIASFVFYGWWDWRFLFLIMASGFIDFFAALCMAKFPRRRKLLLILSIMGNLGALGTFKYLDFGIRNSNWILQFFGIDVQVPAANLILPIGISFYTFQSMSYTIDAYRGLLKPTRNILHFFAYLALFPQLVAGPIVRARQLLPQLKVVKTTTEEQRWHGLNLIVWGFFKKVVVADSIAPVVNAAFASQMPEQSFSYWWIVMIMFGFQIYCDFSGYSDIARGLGTWMGYEFPVNFRNPYIASSFREFWQRWHISLSTWFRDYVYIPLGGSKKGDGRAHGNMWITMLISGLWHGAAWHFILWAVAHSFYMSLERVTGWPERLKKLRGGTHLATLFVFLLTTLAWVFFRSNTFGQALEVLSVMFNPGDFNYAITDDLVDNNAINVTLIMIGTQLFFYFGLDKAPWATGTSRVRRALEPVALAVLIMVCVYMRGPGSQFIYFQF